MGDELGGLVFLRVNAGGGYITPGGQTDGTLTRSQGEAEVTDKDSSNWKENIVAIREWSFTGAFIYDDGDSGYQAMRDAYHNQTTLTADFYDSGAGTYHRGTVNVSELTHNFPLAEAANYTVTLSGTSTLSNL